MKTNRHPPTATDRLLAAQYARLHDMFDGALPPEPPEPLAPAPASHDFLVMCCRPDAQPPQPAQPSRPAFVIVLRTAA